MSTFKIEHPNPTNQLPDGVPYNKRDHPEMPCIVANKCLFVLVLVLLSPLILLATLILVPLSCYTRRWERRFIREMYARQGHVFESSRGPVEYNMFGSAPYIFYVPGGGGGIDEIREDMLKPTHQDRGVGVIIYSRPGFRRTPISCGPSWAEQADLMAELLDHLGVKSVVACGRSGGGPTAIHFAARHPDKCAGLLLFYCNIYPVGGLSRTTPRMPAPLGWNIRLMYWLSSLSVGSWMSCSNIDSSNPQVLHYVLDSLLKQESDYTEKERAEEKSRLITEEPEMTKKLVELMSFVAMPMSVRWRGCMNDHFRQAWDMQLPFDKIFCPTLLIHGRRDNDNSFQQSEYGARMIKGAKLVLLDQGYHPAELCKEFPAAWEEALAMIRASKAAEGGAAAVHREAAPLPKDGTAPAASPIGAVATE